METVDGQIQPRIKGTPQGGVVSPLLANLFLHYAFDIWLGKEFPQARFERYADDIVIHCVNLQHAKAVLERVVRRFKECGLEVHQQKTKIFYCKDTKRNWGGKGFATEFDFLGFTFRQRTARQKGGGFFMGFQPAMSKESRKKISQTIKSWHIGRRGDLSIEDMSHDLNPTIRGWVNYYGKYYRRAFNPIRKQFHVALTRWAHRRYSAKFNNAKRQPSVFIYEIARTRPELFAFWSEFYDGKSIPKKRRKHQASPSKLDRWVESKPISD
jgi:RNA-directed DNA polymerase